MRTAAKNLFTQHARSWRGNRYVYPVLSRRSSGLSIGVNLNPDKACNFDCIYCSVDRTVPGAATRDVDLTVLESELDEMLTLAVSGRIFQEPPFDQTPAQLRRLNDVAFSGDGEPTACDVFPEACALAAELLERHGVGASCKLIVITNATLLDRPRVAEALETVHRHNGEVWAKLDAGTEPYYQMIDRTRVPLQRVLDNIRAAGRRHPVVIQSLFMRVRGEAPPPAEIDAFVSRLEALRDHGCQIKSVQIYTVARAPAEAYVTPLEIDALRSICANVRARGFSADVYPGPGPA